MPHTHMEDLKMVITFALFKAYLSWVNDLFRMMYKYRPIQTNKYLGRVLPAKIGFFLEK